MNSSYLKRIGIFFQERFPFVLTLIATLVGVVSIYLVWAVITPGAALLYNKSIVVATIGFFLLTLILRICDEFKDKEVDAILFPERCLPKGLVTYNDIKILMGITVWIWIPLNYIWGGTPVIFTLLVFYVFLFYKYFFFPDIISKNLIMALITHNPLMYIASFYSLSLFSAEQSLPVLSSNNFLLALGFWMPSLYWETARKIRAPKNETDYITYSKVLGPVKACLIPLGAVFTQLLVTIYLLKDLSYGMVFSYGSVFIYAIYFSFFVAFMITKKDQYSKKFQQVTEGYILFTSVLIIVVCLAEIFQ